VNLMQICCSKAILKPKWFLLFYIQPCSSNMCMGMLLRRDFRPKIVTKSLKNNFFMEPNELTFIDERAHFFPFEVGWG